MNFRWSVPILPNKRRWWGFRRFRVYRTVVRMALICTYIEVERSVPIGWVELQLIPEPISSPYKQFLIVFRSRKYSIPREQNFPLLEVQFQNNPIFRKCEEYEKNDIPKYEKGLKRIDITGLIERIERIYIFLRLVLFGFFHIVERDRGLEINRLSSAKKNFVLQCSMWYKALQEVKMIL